MKKEYIQPEMKQWFIHSEALLDFNVSVDPSTEGNQEEAESEEYQWDSNWDLPHNRERRIWNNE